MGKPHPHLVHLSTDAILARGSDRGAPKRGPGTGIKMLKMGEYFLDKISQIMLDGITMVHIITSFRRYGEALPPQLAWCVGACCVKRK